MCINSDMLDGVRESPSLRFRVNPRPQACPRHPEGDVLHSLLPRLLPSLSVFCVPLTTERFPSTSLSQGAEHRGRASLRLARWAPARGKGRPGSCFRLSPLHPSAPPQGTRALLQEREKIKRNSFFFFLKESGSLGLA